MKKNMLILSATLLFVVIGASLNAQKNSSGTRYNPQFNYQPEKREAVASANISIAIIKPVFADKELAKLGEPWSQFSNKMADDIEALLTAKGYKVRGPYTSRDEMVFNDKQSSDFTLEITIDLIGSVHRNWKSSYNIFSQVTSYKVKSGDASLTTSVIMTAKSNFSGEKLWKKSLPLSQKNFTYSGTTSWTDQGPTFNREMQEDNNFYSPLAKQLEIIYAEALDILWKQFDVNEMKTVADEAKKEKAANNKN